MPIRVLIVDGSVLVRNLVSQVLSAADGIEVVGTAVHGKAAQEKVRLLRPDLVTMDVDMPEMDGISAVRALRASGEVMPIIMFSTLTEHGAAATIDALTAGASDYVTKPARSADQRRSSGAVGEGLIAKIYALVPAKAPAALQSAGRRARLALTGPATTPRVRRTGPVELAVVGSSTGGPKALVTLVQGLRSEPPVPVLIVQHMPAPFTKQLADRLGQGAHMRVSEAVDGEALRPGRIYIAPGGRHLEVDGAPGKWRAAHSGAPPVNYSRPSVDVLFRSAARAVGAQLLAVVLTGMGSDGAAGAVEIFTAGGTVLAQDRATSVVWGMPGAVAARGSASALLPLEQVAPTMEAVMAEGRR